MRRQASHPRLDGFRIAQISDIHYGPYMDRAGVARGLQVAQKLAPDLVALTGDFTSRPLGKAYGIDGARHAEPCADEIVKWKGVQMVAVRGAVLEPFLAALPGTQPLVGAAASADGQRVAGQAGLEVLGIAGAGHRRLDVNRDGKHQGKK